MYFEACTKRIKILDEDIKSWLKMKCEEYFYQAGFYQRKNSMSGSGYFVLPPHMLQITQNTIIVTECRKILGQAPIGSHRNMENYPQQNYGYDYRKQEIKQ